MRANHRGNFVGGTFLGLLLVCAASCNRDSGVPLFQVTGSIFVEGEPAVGALVVFHPQGDAVLPKPRGVVDENGKFQLTTHSKDDGAPAGSYDVTVVWRDQPDEDERGTYLLPRRFLNPKTSELRAEVEQQSTQLPPFRLEP